MGSETILYYVTEESITGVESPVKTYFWKKIKLRAFAVEEDGLSIVAVLIPCLLKEWKKEKLFRRVQEAMAEYPDYPERAELIIQPKLSRLLMSQEKYPILMQSDEFSVFYWELAERLLEKKFDAAKGSRPLKTACPESVFLLLGNSFFPEEQMRRFSEMMRPYFLYMNHLTILYEPDSDSVADHHFAQERFEEAISDYTDTFAFEYGLVSQIWCGSDYPAKRRTEGSGGLTLCFDCGYQGIIPLRALKAGDVYLDVFSSERKESLFRRKRMEISYLSPLKYLDTVVKSGYDRLVNPALRQV